MHENCHIRHEREKLRKDKLESQEFKLFVSDACKSIDNLISTNKNNNASRAKEIDGFIIGFVKYLETRDKNEILRRNIRKIKKVLRGNEKDSVWTNTKEDQLVRIIEKFEKRDQKENNFNSQEISGLAINSEIKFNGEFVQFVDDLCKREFSPDFDKLIARKTVNQQFKENMKQNFKNLEENPGEIEFIINNHQQAETSVTRRKGPLNRRSTVDLLE